MVDSQTTSGPVSKSSDFENWSIWQETERALSHLYLPFPAYLFAEFALHLEVSKVGAHLIEFVSEVLLYLRDIQNTNTTNSYVHVLIW